MRLLRLVKSPAELAYVRRAGESAPPADVAVLIGQGHGLSRRETEVCALTARGLSTPDMAQHLSISANTVQDHLKSIFDKTGARNRRELVSLMFFEEYAPRARQPPGAYGPLRNHRLSRKHGLSSGNFGRRARGGRALTMILLVPRL